MGIGFSPLSRLVSVRPQHAGGRLGVLEEQLVEIAHAEQQQRIAAGLFGVLVLLHHGSLGHSGHGSSRLLAGREGERQAGKADGHGNDRRIGFQPVSVGRMAGNLCNLTGVPRRSAGLRPRRPRQAQVSLGPHAGGSLNGSRHKRNIAAGCDRPRELNPPRNRDLPKRPPMQEHQETIWERLPEYCEKLGDDMRRRVDQRLWAKFDASGFGNSIAADAFSIGSSSEGPPTSSCWLGSQESPNENCWRSGGIGWTLKCGTSAASSHSTPAMTPGPSAWMPLFHGSRQAESQCATSTLNWSTWPWPLWNLSRPKPSLCFTNWI